MLRSPEPVCDPIKTKEQKTNADPVSFCNRISNIGINIIVIAAIRVFHFLKSAVTEDSVFANANAVAPFANSEGCIPKSPRETPSELKQDMLRPSQSPQTWAD